MCKSVLLTLTPAMVLADIRSINSEAVFARRTGMLILGGGTIKHHICNANLMVGL